MAISVNPVLPVLAAQEAGSVAPELVLQPGSVVNAQVLKSCPPIWCGSRSPACRSTFSRKFRCRQGQTLQLAVSQSKDGDPARGGRAGRRRQAPLADAVTLSPEALIDAAASRPTIVAAPKNVLTPRSARRSRRRRRPRPPSRTAWRRCLPISAPSPRPAACRRNCSRRSRRCWRNRPASIKTSTAATSRPRSRNPAFFSRRRWRQALSPPAALPDLKAALIVLRQTLQSSLGADADDAGTQAAPAAEAPAAAACRRRTRPCAVAVADLDVAGNPAAAGAAARRRTTCAQQAVRGRSALAACA